jgi:hypothetical protein
MSYLIGKDPTGIEYIYCHECGMKSYNQDDIEHRYCDNCHKFHIEPVVYRRMLAVTKANINNPPKHVKHSELKRANPQAFYRSECPECKLGVLLVTRDKETFVVLETDYCVLCGQQFIYDDVERLRGLER